MMDHDDWMARARARADQERLRQYRGPRAPVGADAEGPWEWMLRGLGYGLAAAPLVWLLVQWVSGDA